MLVVGIKISFLVFLISIYRVKLRLAEGRIVLMLHRIVKSSFIQKLFISFLIYEWNLSILIELRLLVREHESVSGTTQLGTSGTYSAAGEIVLVGKATEAILLILPLHIMNLSLQIGDFLFFSILLAATVRIDLNIIP